MRKTSKVSSQKTAVKQIKETEIDKLVPIYLDAFEGMRDQKLVKQWLRSNIRAFPQKMCFGIWRGDSLLGYIIWAEKGTFRPEAVWDLEQIAVLSKYRRQGIGTKLIRDSLSEIKVHLRKRGAELRLIKVTTGINNESARLYEKVLGAKKECVISDFYNGDEQILIARTNPTNTNLSEDDKALLKLEYQECQAGYNNRDKIVPDELRNVGLVFTFLTGALFFAINILQNEPDWLLWLAAGIIGIFGFLLLFGFLIDIQSNVSCKKVLRQRSAEIEDLLSPAPSGIQPNTVLQIWRKVIPKRKRKWEERVPKSLLRRKSPEGETDYFILAARIAIGLWLLLVIFGAIFGT
ncbi:MAG: GNAT family N-acetyltransferase [Desulfobacteraceae bacterium]|nr:MAG: GNAT family N-acetyltransferase [Desulfobacteraceae bacterium]